jgi:hypothetical protein
LDFTRDVGSSATRNIPVHGRCAESDLASLERYVVDATAVICLIRYNRTEIDGDCTLVAADLTVHTLKIKADFVPAWFSNAVLEKISSQVPEE